MVNPNPVSTKERLEELYRRKEIALGMGGPDKIARHHASGRLTARERLNLLLDEGSFYEIGLLAEPELRHERPIPADGAITGFGRIDGRKVCVIAIDATVLAGTTAPISMKKQGRIAEFAARKGLPLVLLVDADGGRIPDVMGWRFSGLPFDFSTFLQVPEGYPEIPRLAAVLGPGYGDSALHAGTARIVVMTEQSSIALSGPSVVASAIGEQVTDQDLGGPEHAQEVGTAHLVVPTEKEAFDALSAYLSYLPSNAARPAPLAPSVAPARSPESLRDVVPSNPKQAYDMFEVIEAVVDADTILPWRPEAGKAAITAFTRIGGQPVGVVANQPRYGAGALDAKALEKVHDFVDMCDTFNLPLLFLQDVPGLMIGVQAERQGIVLRYERLVARLARATVPKVVVVVRKAYGGGHFAMGGRPTKPDLLVCWPTAELGFMAPDTGVKTVNRRKLEKAEAEGGIAARRKLEAELTAEWIDESAPWEAAAHVYVDDIIDPADTRHVVLTGIEYGWGDRDRVSS
ncbi:carboxyl transferase domain-containing protein [Thermocrispum sp.]|uniref:Carboxyl transferase domain-containing protein n=1 Tax=Thermocrispum agreste TaxID=37925 RepID=A0ABD6FEQ6_9PSEU|nr:carboxyl transferase domain-containing protein [Thermocrispum sp.]